MATPWIDPEAERLLTTATVSSGAEENGTANVRHRPAPQNIPKAGRKSKFPVCIGFPATLTSAVPQLCPTPPAPAQMHKRHVRGIGPSRLSRRARCNRAWYKGLNGWRVGPEGAGTLCQCCHNKWLRGEIVYESRYTPLKFGPGGTPDAAYAVVSVERYREQYAGRFDGAAHPTIAHAAGPSYPGDTGNRGARLPGGKRNKPILVAEDGESSDVLGWAGPPADHPALAPAPATPDELAAVASLCQPGYRPCTRVLAARRPRRSTVVGYTYHGTLYTRGAWLHFLDSARPRIKVERLKVVPTRSGAGAMPVFLRRCLKKSCK